MAGGDIMWWLKISWHIRLFSPVFLFSYEFLVVIVQPDIKLFISINRDVLVICFWMDKMVLMGPCFWISVCGKLSKN